MLGATTLEEFALALLIGQISGAYSSIFIASPALAILKEREPRFNDVRKRIEARASSRAPVQAPPVVDDVVGDTDAARSTGTSAAPTATATKPPPAAAGAIPPRPRKKPKRR